ncbi:GGDEF domain-containing protein [Pseudoxanthomonas sp. JBR18]|uniref:GGDEF domain-containing protein n=1 Tax=Pseudoxanthomonas sp. JBR18 TaxID=2969308 RepID=UPI002306AC60|nr:GGDEF domain-containing protein [Pseudoxanthomonas sp. JBR18]WCE04131.1 GGDEF domain-containing protein [Pseudoxanthomonas sp. JBR18]
MRLKLRYASIALGLMALHVLVATGEGLRPEVAEQLLRLGVMSAALAALWRQRALTIGTLRALWGLLALAVTMQVVWGSVLLLGTLWPARVASLSIAAEVASALYTLPCMYLIAGAFSHGEPRAVRILDAGTSLLLGVLLALLIVTVVRGAVPAGLDATRFAIWHADVIDFSLALLATLRLLGARSINRRYLYWVAAAFLWFNAIDAAVYNRLSVAGPTGWSAILIEPAFVAVAILAGLPPPRWLRRYRPSVRTGRVIAAFAPVAISLGVLMLGLSLSRLHFAGGAAAVMLAAILYGLRVAFVQTRHQDLREQVDLDNRQLQLQLGIDPLTGIANRGALDARVREILASGVTCSLLMIDVDHFKQFNDSQGHVRGDQCLVRVAAALKGCLQRADELVARYGGEEFAAVMPAASQADTEAMARRLLGAVSGLRIAHPASPLGHVSVSIGIAIRQHDWLDEGDTTLSLFQAADQALYKAKAEGRNRIHPAPAVLDRQVAFGT